jgi:hypothetical protein
MTVAYVIFDKDGIPETFNAETFEGAEEVALPEKAVIPARFLLTHRRTEAGDWVPRDPPPPPTEDDLAREAEIAGHAEAEARLQANRALEEEVARRAQPDALLRSMGMITIADLKARVAAIRADVEAGR